MKACLVALALLALASTAARASDLDWEVDAVKGDVAIAQDGHWAPLEKGDFVPAGKAVKTGGAGVVTLKRLGAYLRLEPRTRIEVHEALSAHVTTVDQESGRLGVDLRDASTLTFRVKTAHVVATMKSGSIGVIAEAAVTTIVDQRGDVRVNETRHGGAQADLTPRQMARATASDLVVGPADTSVPAVAAAAAADAAAGIVRKVDAEPVKDQPKPDANAAAPGAGDAASSSAIADPELDALRKASSTADKKVDPKMLAAAMKAMNEEDGEGGVNGAALGAAAGAAAGAVESGNTEIDLAGAGDSFAASESAANAQAAAKAKKARAPKPVHAALRARLYSAIGQFDMVSAIMLGFMFAMSLYASGLLMNAILQDVGFGTFGNASLAFLGCAFGAGVRDVLFFTEFWYAFEPFVSIFLIVGSALGFVVGACVAKARLFDPAIPSAKAPVSIRLPRDLAARSRAS